MNQWPRGHFSGKARTEAEIFNELDGHFFTLDPEKAAVRDSWQEPFEPFIPKRSYMPPQRKPGWWHPDMLPELKRMLGEGYSREEIAQALGIKEMAVYHQENRLILIAQGKLKPKGPA